jgi:hypothetical protein
MHVIATELGPDWSGPYTDIALANKILAIVRQLDPEAEIISKDANPYAEQINAGLQPYHIHVSVIGGEPQLPAEVRLTWPPADAEGIQDSSSEETNYFVWALNEKDALLRLARLNKATPRASTKAKAEATA